MSSTYGSGGPGEFADDATITEVEKPINVKLARGTPLHGKVLNALKNRLDLSWRHISKRYDAWDQVDEKCRLFFDLSRPAKLGDGTADTTGKREMPFGRSIVMPSSYAIAEVRKSQMVSLALARDPVHQLTGKGNEDVKPAKALEATLAYDATQSGLPLELLSFYQDADKYGLGILYDTWEVERGFVYGPPPITQIPMLGQMIPQALGQRLFPSLYQRKKEWGTRKQYTNPCAVDPFNAWPDPRVPVSQVQKAEFWGHRTYSGRSYYQAKSQARGDGIYFNLEELEKLQPTTGVRAGGSQSQVSRSRSRYSGTDFMLGSDNTDKDRGFYSEDHFQWKLIPREWELGDSDRPEIWWFSMLEEQLIVRAHECPYEHGEFSYSVGETNPDPHSLFNPGSIELMDGPQRFIDWLYNSRYQNVIRMMNLRYIYDPRYIKRDDVENPYPGTPIELTIEGQLLADQGVDPRKFIFQLPVQDVTIELFKDVEFLFEMMQRSTAASDPALGTPTQEQRTLGEVQSLLAAGSQRVSQTVKMMDEMAIKPMVLRQVSNRQQFTTETMYYRIAGDEATKILGAQGGRQLISPTDIQGNFDYEPVTGTMPADPARHAETWMRALEVMKGVAPFLMEQSQLSGEVPNIAAIVNEALKAMGIKTLEDFWIKLPQMDPMLAAAATAAPGQVMPDEQVAAGVKAGNLVPGPM